MTQLGRALPDQLANELKVVLKYGTRPASIVTRLDGLPGLSAACSPAPSISDWELAIAICQAVEKACQALGDGAYGHAARRLFGIDAATRGLVLGRRRLVAADDLQVDPATVARHWEARIRLDVAVQVFTQSAFDDLESESRP